MFFSSSSSSRWWPSKLNWHRNTEKDEEEKDWSPQPTSNKWVHKVANPIGTTWLEHKVGWIGLTSQMGIASFGMQMTPIT
jgi:hypothetical protein